MKEGRSRYIDLAITVHAITSDSWGRSQSFNLWHKWAMTSWPWLFTIFLEIILPGYIWIILSHYKDPYKHPINQFRIQRFGTSCSQAEIPTAAMASGSQDAPEFCHRNLWLSDGPTGRRKRRRMEMGGGKKAGTASTREIRCVVVFRWHGFDGFYLKYLCFQNRLEMTKKTRGHLKCFFLLNFRFTYALSIDGQQASEVCFVIIEMNWFILVFPFELAGWWIFWFLFGCLFVWIPSEKNSYITCLQLVVYVIPHFWKISSIFWERIRLHLLKKHLGRGEEDPAFFQLLENHTEENLKLNLCRHLICVHCRFPFLFCCSDIQLLCKGKCIIN